MLVLSRKKSEMIQIGEDIVIKVIRTGKTSVKIGVEAPDHVRVLRAEICEEGAPMPRIDGFTFAEGEDDGPVGPAKYTWSDQYPNAI